jgi:uncharacterized membrane protein
MAVVIATFLGFFIGEVFGWATPALSEFVVPRLNAGLDLPTQEQAATLRTLFINQGVYNLMFGLAGVAGLVLTARGNRPAGLALLLLVGVAGVAAGITLAATSTLWAGATVQAGCAALGLGLVARDALGRPERAQQ